MRTLFSLTVAAAGLLCCHVPLAHAEMVYQITVNTSSISGTAGSLDFNFNPGFFSVQAASADILSFGGNGTLTGSPSVTGDVTGVLPATVTFDNGTGLNDYFTDYTFGSTLVFLVRLYGPAVDSPDNFSTSGTTFAFSMFSDAAGTIPALTTDTVNGFAATLDVNPGGSVTPATPSAETFLAPAPEPSSLVTLGILLAGAACGLRRRQSARQSA